MEIANFSLFIDLLLFHIYVYIYVTKKYSHFKKRKTYMKFVENQNLQSGINSVFEISQQMGSL